MLRTVCQEQYKGSGGLDPGLAVAEPAMCDPLHELERVRGGTVTTIQAGGLKCPIWLVGEAIRPDTHGY